MPPERGEIINDWLAFQSYAGTELYRQIIDTENAELLQGNAGSEFTGTTVGAGASGMTGFMNTSGILLHDAADDSGTNVTVIDSIEKSIAALRVGPALATADLLVLNPLTWSATRRLKDTVGRFLFISADSDPSNAQADQIFDVPVLHTTQMPAGFGLMLDSSKFGYVAVRESLSMRIGHSGTDFAQHLANGGRRTSGVVRDEAARGAADQRVTDVMIRTVRVKASWRICYQR
jgi:HK97 family phage major capsid protein